MAYTRKDYTGGAAQTTIVGDLTSGSLSISIASATGWPTGSNGPFTVVIDAGTASEEKVLVTSRSSTVLTVASSGDRGYDGTTATSHLSGATIDHCLAAKDLDEANYAVSQTVGKVTTAGDLLVGTAANTLARTAKGSNSTVFGVDSGGTLGYTTVTNAMVSASAGIPFSKLETMSTGYVLGNNSGSTAAPSALAISTLVDGYTTVTKGSNESVSSSTAVQNDDELLFTASSGTPYVVSFAIVYANAAGATPDIKIDVGEDSTARGVFAVYYNNSADTETVTALTSNQTTTLTAGTATTKRTIYGQGWHTGAGGTFRIRWAQGTSNATATIVYAGSYLRYRAAT